MFHKTFLPFALLDAQAHPLAVNVADFQPGDLTGPKPGGIGAHQQRALLTVSGHPQ